jgi:membrane protease YdiL (CAAX protease family)
VGEVLRGVSVLMVVGAVVEEVTFRGLILRLLEACTSSGRAQVLCAGLFVLVHLPAWWSMGMRVELVVMGAALFVLALLLGWLARRTGTIWLSTLLHVLNNAFASG